MSTAKQLLEQYPLLFHGKTVDLNDMAGWYNQAREFLQRIEIADDVGELIDLAYMVGRGEREPIQLCGGFARALSIRRGMCDLDEQREAAQKAYQLKAEGIRDFVARVAEHKGVNPATVRRWMKQYPPITRA